MATKKSEEKIKKSRPKSPLPEQNQPRPGIEAKMEPKPQFLATNYKGSEKLLDKVAIITGGDSGIGRSVAVLYAREGADISIVYLPVEQADAEETARCIENEGRRCLLIPGDVSKSEFCQSAIEKTVNEFGKLNIESVVENQQKESNCQFSPTVYHQGIG